MNKNFIMIDFNIFTMQDNTSQIHRIGTNGLLLYCELILNKSLYETSMITIKLIKEHIDLDNRTLTKLLKLLELNNLIQLIDMGDIKKLGENTIIKYKINRFEKYISIPVAIIENELTHIGSVGLTLLFLLTRLHNNNYGGVGCSGFSNPSYEYLGLLLGLDKKTIMKYISILEKRKLLKVEKQGSIYIETNNGTEVKRESNHYFVQHIVNNKNKYYIEK